MLAWQKEVLAVANLSVRNLDDGVHRALRRRADQSGRSMEAEVRQILIDATREDLDLPADPFLRLISRAKAAGGAELEMPPPQFESRMDTERGVFD